MTRYIGKRGKVDLRRLTRLDLAYLHFKLALGLMLFVPLIQSPSLTGSTTGLFLIVWALVTGVGLVVSVIGLVMGSQHAEARRKGIITELVGLTLLMAGPTVFLAVQVGLLVTGGKVSGLAIMFPYVIAAALLCRMVMVNDAAKPVVYKIRGVDPDEE